MAYDPKKKRPSTKSVDSVVDEIFGEESAPDVKPKSKAKPKANAKNSSSSQTVSHPAGRAEHKVSALAANVRKDEEFLAPDKSPHTPKPKSESKAPAERQENTDKTEELTDNVIPLYSKEDQEVPLITQPKVWIGAAIGALVLLFLIKKRK